MRLRLCCTGVALLLAAGCHSKAQEKKAPPPREVDVLTVTPSTVRDMGEYLGSLVSRSNVNVLPQVGGYVRAIRVRPGQRVPSGAVLIQIDARQESAALESAQAQQRSTASSLELARQTLTRTEALYTEGLVSAQELERARAAVDAADAARRSAGAQVSQRQVQLQYYDVKAPFAGTVGDVLVRVGDFVSGTTVLTTLAQADVLEVSVAVPVERARQIKQGTELEILGSGDEWLRTEVYFIAPQADPKTQLVDVKGIFENRFGLRPSELVRTRVLYRTREAIQIPPLAVTRQGGQPFVFVVTSQEGNTVVQRRPVTLGSLGDGAYVVEKGLSQGERIATSSIQMLRDGAAIRPKALPAAQEATRRQERPSVPSKD